MDRLSVNTYLKSRDQPHTPLKTVSTRTRTATSWRRTTTRARPARAAQPFAHIRRHAPGPTPDPRRHRPARLHGTHPLGRMIGACDSLAADERHPRRSGDEHPRCFTVPRPAGFEHATGADRQGTGHEIAHRRFTFDRLRRFRTRAGTRLLDPFHGRDTEPHQGGIHKRPTYAEEPPDDRRQAWGRRSPGIVTNSGEGSLARRPKAVASASASRRPGGLPAPLAYPPRARDVRATRRLRPRGRASRERRRGQTCSKNRRFRAPGY